MKIFIQFGRNICASAIFQIEYNKKSYQTIRNYTKSVMLLETILCQEVLKCK